MKDRSVWPECRESSTHDQCAGSTQSSECICWHHVVHQRHVEHALELLVQIDRELGSIDRRSPHDPWKAASRADQPKK
jgi:hypothetical protein